MSQRVKHCTERRSSIGDNSSAVASERGYTEPPQILKIKQIKEKDSMQKTMVLRNQVIEAYSKL